MASWCQGRAGQADRSAGSAGIGRWNIVKITLLCVFLSTFTQATLAVRHGQGSDGKKIVHNSIDAQWPTVSRDMCPKTVRQTVRPHQPNYKPAKSSIFYDFRDLWRPLSAKRLVGSPPAAHPLNRLWMGYKKVVIHVAEPQTHRALQSKNTSKNCIFFVVLTLPPI